MWIKIFNECRDLDAPSVEKHKQKCLASQLIPYNDRKSACDAQHFLPTTILHTDKTTTILTKHLLSRLLQ